jgi:hypothetical protein
LGGEEGCIAALAARDHFLQRSGSTMLLRSSCSREVTREGRECERKRRENAKENEENRQENEENEENAKENEEN